MPAQGTYNSATGVWTVGSIASGASISLTLSARVVSPNPETTVATVAALQFDPNAGNNTASVTETPQTADLSVTASTLQATPNVGDTIAELVTVVNNGPDAANLVTVSVQLPAGLVLVAAMPAQGTYDNSTGVWTVGSLASGASISLTLSARVVSPDPETTVATVAALQRFDLEHGQQHRERHRSAPQTADLSVTASTLTATPNVGDTIAELVTVVNNGPDAASSVMVSAQLPPGLVLVTATPGQGTYNSATGVWTVGSLASGASVSLTLSAQVVSPNPVTTVATVAALQFDPNTGNNTASVTESPQAADLSVTASTLTATPNVGDTIAELVTVVNNGPDAANLVTVNVQLPAGLVLVAAMPAQGSYNSATGVWTVGSIASGASVSLTLSARVVSPSPETTVATVAALQFDPNTGNNTASVTEAPQTADLSVTASTLQATPNVGDTIAELVTVVNNGPDAANLVTVNVQLPAGLVLVAAMPGQGTYDTSTGVWTVGSIASGASVSLTLSARVASPNPVTTVATVAALQFDPNTGNNTASVTESPQAADLSVTASTLTATPNVGDTIAELVTVVNNGPDAANLVTVNVQLPAGLVLVAAMPGQGTYNSATGVWTVGSIASGASVSLTLSARVVSPNPETTVATVAALQFDPNTGNNTASVTESPQAADLSVTASTLQATPNVGDTIAELVTVVNNGPDAANLVTVNVQLPAGLVLVAAMPGQGTYNKRRRGVWTVPGSIASGASISLTLKVRGSSALTQKPRSRPSPRRLQFDPNTGNNTRERHRGAPAGCRPVGDRKARSQLDAQRRRHHRRARRGGQQLRRQPGDGERAVAARPRPGYGDARPGNVQ